MSIQKGKHQSGQTQGYSQRYPHAPSFIVRSSTPQRPEVSFHVPNAAFTQQQGGGAGPPSAPQLRAIHHPHHSGSPSLPPPHQQQPPPQAQSQHTGGPQGPTPTSTPPGPAEMGKQGPPHMQGQPPMQQGGQMPLNFVPNQTRTPGSQPFFPRGPAPRMQNHRNQVVNMQPNNVGQQMFPQHMPMSQVQQIYGQMPTQIPTPQMFVPSQLSVFTSQPRHQNHTGGGYYQQTAPQQILMTPQVYQGFQHPASSPQYYYQSPVALPRPSGGVTGAPGPGGLAGTASQPVMTGGPNPSQLGQPGGPVTLGIVQGPGGVVGVGGLGGDTTAGPATTSATAGKQTRRKYAIDIIDPKTMKNVDVYEGSTTSSSTPPRSGESSARDTPQPNTGPGAMDVVAEFAARVAKAASEKSSPPPPPVVPQTGPPAYVEPSQVVTANGPDPSGTNSIPPSECMASGSVLTPGEPLPISKQQIVVVEESSNMPPMAPPIIPPVTVTPSTWKQGQLPHSTSTNLGSKPSGSNSKSDISGQAVSDEKLGPTKLEIEPQAVDFVPSVSAAELKNSISPVVVSKDLESITPVVSAQTGSPIVDVRGDREQFPALKSSAPIQQSPRRKQTQRPEAASNVPQATTVAANSSVQSTLPPALSTSRETTPTAETKGSKKPASTEESTPPSSAFPISQSPKERRDQDKSHGREREKSSSISSQGRGEREKSVSSPSSSSSQHHGRDREKSSFDKDRSSLDKDKANAASQGGPKDCDKSASRGRDRDKSSTKEAAPVPSPGVPAAPVVTCAASQPQAEQPVPARPPPAPEGTKQNNGEVTVADTTEGKASQRAKPKQPRHQKMRDLNRKGAEKEGGTDMDAFTEPSPEETTPLTPSSLSPSSQPLVPAMPNKVTDNQIVKDEETEVDKEEKLVAARNEENVKVSAAALKEDTSSTTPVIENIPVTKPTTLTLRHTYKEDQWSPLNPEGKKRYERDFLMELQNDPQSKKKPDNLPDLEVVLKDNTNRQRMADRSYSNMNRPVPDRSSHDTFTPGFMRTSNSRGPVAKRNSQQGKAKTNKPVIHMTLSLKEDVKLRETENAWKPDRMKASGANEEEAKTEELYKKVRGVLNKLTPQKFSTLVSQVQALPIDNNERLQGVINLVFEKAVDEPNFSEAYANMCKVLSMNMQAQADRKNKDEPEFSFRKLLVSRCQVEFEKSSEVELNREVKLKEIEETADPEKKKELQLIFEEEERKIRMKSVGNIRFIGELFKLGMLTTNIMQRCIKDLLTEQDEESLECLCKLLTTVGKELENKNQNLSDYFSKMKEISEKRGEVSSRVRFMLRDVIDLRNGKWIPRRNDSNPKTMEQIQKEAEKETLDQQLLLNSAPLASRAQDDRVQSNRRNRGGGGMSEDGWNKVGMTGRPSRYTVDTTKLKAAKEDTAIILGNVGQFRGWSGGANAKGKDANKRPVTAGGDSTYSPNMYAALDTSSEDGKRPLPLASSRPGPGKTTPSPSTEKERVLALFRTPAEGDGRQSRSSTSRSSSRDNSARRGGDEPSSLRPYAPSSQLPLTSASTEDISGSGAVSGMKNPVVSAAPLSIEGVQKKICGILDEFLFNSNYKESEVLVIESFPPESFSMFVRESLNDMLERSSTARQNVGKLMSHLVKADIIPLHMYLSGLNEFLEFADDIAIDVPKFWPYIAEVIVPMLLSEAMSFADFRKVAQPVHGKLILEVLNLLVKDKGPVWIRQKWEAAGLKWTDFLPADKVDEFVEQNVLEYTLDGAASAPSASSSTPLNWDHVQQKLEQFLKQGQPSFDPICDWINVNVGDQVKEPQFIRALMTAICQSAIESQKTSLKLNEGRLHQHEKLMLRYIDNKAELELQCLYAIQSLINKLEHPQGLLCQIFHVLWDSGTMSNDSFILWETSTDPAEQAGKGVALKSLTTFFTALREGDEDSSCEES